MQSTVADIKAVSVLVGCLFAPIAIGAASLVAVPFAIFRPSAGWPLLALVVADYVVPLSRRPWAWYYDLVFKRMAQLMSAYFPKFKVSVDPAFQVDKARRYLVCAHPHGVFGFYIGTVADKLLDRGLRMIMFGASILTMLPFARRHFSWLGVNAATKETMKRYMKGSHPHNVYYSTPGGIEEMFCVPNPNEQIVVLKRKGFCKIALQCGTDLVPVYGFGNNQLFPIISGNGSFLAKLSNALNVSIAVWLGRWNVPFSCIPTKHPQFCAIGTPIPVQQCENPTQEQIDELHSKYCSAIRELFDKHKGDPILDGCGFREQTLMFEDEGKNK